MLTILPNKLKWAYPLTPYRLNEIDGLAIHNVAHPTWGIEETHAEHLKKGWAGFGYGWFVALDGTVTVGRGFNFQAHCLNHNTHLLSVCFQGDFNDKTKSMPKVQFDAGVELIKDIVEKVPTIKIVDGHKRWRPTACPGKNFPLYAMISAVWTKESEGTKLAKELSALGITSDVKYWADVMDGKETPKPEYLRTIFSRLLSQL